MLFEDCDLLVEAQDNTLPRKKENSKKAYGS
jgi:hypothetical protein